MENEVCVLIASYNGEKYISEQIDSISNQVNVKSCILVRDDGSTDYTIMILEKYKETGILDWYTGEHLNVSKGFFSLLNHAPDCEYYAFCDQDDVWDSDKLKIAIDHLSKFDANKPALYCCGSRLVDQNLNYIAEHKLDTHRTSKARLFFSGITGNTMVLNRALKERLIAYTPENMKMHDSWVYKTCLCLGGNIVIDSESHIAYRQHGANVVGMELTLRKKMNKFWAVVKEKRTMPELEELYSAYNNEVIPEYKIFLKELIEQRGNALKRLKIAFSNDIDFNNFMFNAAFKLKMILGIL